MAFECDACAVSQGDAELSIDLRGAHTGRMWVKGEDAQDWRAARPIRTPGELRAMIAVVAEAVRRGALAPVGEAAATLAELERGVWPDHIALRFRAPDTGEAFELSAETYHGAGGGWRRVD